MNENSFKKKLSFKDSVISRQSAQIESLKLQNENLKLKIREKDIVIDSVSSLRKELSTNLSDVKKCKKEYKELITELRTMKKILNQELFKNRWWLIKFLIK